MTEPAWISRMRAVDWASLDYCYGEHTNVSGLIETIAFGTQDEALDACGTLGNELEHQGSIYSSTYEAIPFLIEAAAVAAPGVRSRVLYLVAEFVGSAIHWIEMAERDPGSGEDYWTANYIERAWLGSEVFARLLHDEGDEILRIVAAYVLGLLLTRGPALAPQTNRAAMRLRSRRSWSGCEATSRMNSSCRASSSRSVAAPCMTRP